MAIRVSPIEPNPTHDISLSDGVTTVGLHLSNPRGEKDRRAMRQVSTPRTSLQIQQGDPDYNGFKLPDTPITQKDWSGGRGQADFKRDSTRYYDSYQVNTVHGSIFLGPLVSNTTNNSTTTGGHSTTNTTGSWPNGATTALYTTYTAAAPLTISAIKFKLGLTGSGGGTFTAHIRSFSGGDPGLASPLAVSAGYFYNSLDEGTEIEFPISYTFSSGTQYWIGFVFQSATANGYPTFCYDNAASGETIKYLYGMSDSMGTFASNASLWFETSNPTRAQVKYFDYKGAKYAVITNDDGSTAPKLYLNGFRGAAKSNSSSKNTVQTDVDLTTAGADGLVGCVVKLISGTGSTERVNYRMITANTSSSSGNSITVSPAWNITQDTTTQFVVLGSGYWTEVTGHGLTGPITDVCVVGDIVYFAQGDLVVVRKGSIQAGSWSWDDEGATTKATFIKLIPDTDGSSKIWLAQASTSYIYSAPTVSWSTDLTLTQKNNSAAVGNAATRITGMIAYGDPRVPWVFKEDGFGSIVNGVYAEVPNAELAAVASENNGRAATVSGVYLFFSILNGFDRYYDQRLDDLGPNRDEGLPTGRQGPIVVARPYPGGIFVGVDAGTAGQSSILFYSGATNGWHEFYRGESGKRISDISLHVIPGYSYQLLWFNLENDLFSMPVAINPLKASGYPFASTGHLITSWYKTTFGQIKKFWRDLQMFAEQIDNGAQIISVEYQTDDNGTWTALPEDFANDSATIANLNPKVLLSTNYDVTGERIRFRITLTRSSSEQTPRVIAYTIGTVTRVPPSKQWGMTFQADDVTVNDADGERDSLDMDSLLAQLDTWANSDETPAPLTMRSLIPQYDNKRVFLDSPNIQIREVALYDSGRDVKAIGSMNLTEA